MKIVEELGRGSSGLVYRVKHVLEGKEYVVKVVDLGKLSQKKQKQSMKEVEILKRLNHPHIIRYYDSVIHEKGLYILTEFASGGDLQKKIDKLKQNKRFLEEGQVWTWAYELSLALKYLHKHKILHRDIKCMNVFIDKANRIKLGDFGLAKVIHNRDIRSSAVGTPLYLSPEQIRHLPYGLKVDIWGLGCVLYKLCALDAPFAGENLNTLGQNIVSKSFRSLPQKFTPRLVAFITHLLDKNPKTRPNILEVIEQIPVFTKKFYNSPILIEKVEDFGRVNRLVKTDNRNQTENIIKFEQERIRDKSEKKVIKIDEVFSKQTILPRFSQLGLDRSAEGPLKKFELNEKRPISQGTGRVVGSSSDTVRLSTAYVRQRLLKDDKPKTTISDLAKIV